MALMRLVVSWKSISSSGASQASQAKATFPQISDPCRPLEPSQGYTTAAESEVGGGGLGGHTSHRASWEF